MAVDAPILLALNRGKVSRLGLARVDVARIALSAEEQVNFMPRVLGSASFRPGLRYIGETLDSNRARHIPFVFSATDTALIELTDEAMRVRRRGNVIADERRLTIHLRFVFAEPANLAESIAEARAVLALAGIELEIKSQRALDAPAYLTVDVLTTQDTELYQLGLDGVSTNESVVYYIDTVREGAQTWNGWALLNGARVIIGKNAGKYILGHELGHNLGLLHTADTNNIMHQITPNITNPPPDLTAGQIITMRNSALAAPIVVTQSDEALVTREAVATTISNGGFDSNLTGWSDVDQGGATSEWVTGGYMGLTGTGFNEARRRQAVTVSGGDAGEVHALRIVVAFGPVTLRIGSTAGGDEYMQAVALRTGTHSLTFEPTGSFHIELAAARPYRALVDSIAIEAEGAMVLPTPWPEAALPLIRHAQSRDVVFIAAFGYPPMRLERRADDSWSIVNYEPEDGPFQAENVGPVSIASSSLTGQTTLTASATLFRSTHVGALFRLTSFGQQVEAAFSGESQFSDPIRVTGVGSGQRTFTYVVGGLTSTGSTITLQRSVGEPGAWLDVTSHVNSGTQNYNDGLDNQIIYYRLGIKSGNYSTGTITLSITYASSGTITGVVRVTAVASTTSASGKILKALGGTAGTTSWSEGEWSDHRGWPSAVAFYEGRLWWLGHDRIWGSASDAFDVFDDMEEGDAATISRSIGAGPTESIHWVLPLQRLLFGAQLAAFSARSSSFDEPLTPTDFALRRVSTQGTANVDAVAVDEHGYYVQAGGVRVYEMTLPDGRFDYVDSDVTAIVPDIGEPSIVDLAVQRQPDTRLHAVRSDGTVAVLVTDPAEGVRAWIEIETAAGDAIEDVCVLPGAAEDRVYYVVRRGSSRFLERVAPESEARGADITSLVDSHVVYEGAPTDIFSVPHLDGRDVVVWADGRSIDGPNGEPLRFTVVGGQVALSETLFSDAFTGSNGAEWDPSKWADIESIGTAAATIQSNQGRITLPGADDWLVRMESTVALVDDFDLRFTIQMSASGAQFHSVSFRADAWAVAVGGSGDRDNPLNGYRMGVNGAQNRLSMSRCDAGVRTSLLSEPVSKVWGTGLWNIRLRVEGSSLMAKAWQGSFEPTTWDIDVTDESFAYGKLMLAFINDDSAAHNVDIDSVVVRRTTVSGLFSSAVIGLPYSWRFKSTKLAYAARFGTAVGMRKRIVRAGLVLADTHARGIRYGQSFDVMQDLPKYEDGALVDPDSIWTEYDKDTFAFPGEWDTDSRICLAGASPRPATVLAVLFVIEGHR